VRIIFQSRYDVVAEMPHAEFQPAAIKAEPQFFSVNKHFAQDKGGNITKAFLRALPRDWQREDLIIDSRVHMLMPGWYPCIPGWHVDDVPRTRPDGQPDHLSPHNRTEHIMAIVGQGSHTIFGVGDFELEDVPIGKGTIYEIWHRDIEGLVARGIVKEERAEPGKLIQFNCDSFHRGAPAHGSGWRWFIRATRYSTREYLNETRTQTQVYLTAPFQGW
jgi:hypothetical protein